MIEKLFLIVAKEKRQPQNDGYVAVITDSPYYPGSKDKITVLSVNVVKNIPAAKKWFKQMKIERPWETRQ